MAAPHRADNAGVVDVPKIRPAVAAENNVAWPRIIRIIMTGNASPDLNRASYEHEVMSQIIRCAPRVTVSAIPGMEPIMIITSSPGQTIRPIDVLWIAATGGIRSA